ncbi:hypothetical protein ABHA37_17435 [Clostridium tertium]|uniref:hypothetical protein n=1 Tax=Clostridium TaxID=1485 RepID=UPI00232F4261|nr:MULTISPECIES: hypothetical protein [Clostridium]MDB1923565.1 hypothetical protein [Clostridium tertium]MDB1930766.1 hypothetical protein [Clostridium tertium]MDU7948671.1 hypothetical protein [Clostridium sp.]
MALKIPISFAENEEEINMYNYVRGKRSQSAYIKDLIEEDMIKKGLINKESELPKEEGHINNKKRVESDLGLDF